MNNPPAFPIYFQPHPEMSFECRDQGMTLRDYFAAAAMQGFIINQQAVGTDESTIAKRSLSMADAMLKAREE